MKEVESLFTESLWAGMTLATFFPAYVDSEIDKIQKPGNTYYWHYHRDRYSHIHIWYYD